jgi:hypothetical protein
MRITYSCIPESAFYRNFREAEIVKLSQHPQPRLEIKERFVLSFWPMVHDYVLNNTQRPPCLRFGFFVLLISSMTMMSAQDDAALGHSSLVEYAYAFSVDGVEDPVAAKHIIHAFVDADFSASVIFIDEVNEFKLQATRSLDYVMLEQFLLQKGGWSLGPKVRTARGEVLKASDNRPIEPGGR